MNYSLIATQVPGMRDPRRAIRRKPWGLLLHTTGRGVPKLAAAKGRTALDVAIAVYRASQNGSNGYPWGGPHYVLDYDGGLHQIAPDDAVTAHAGGGDRVDYLDGDWEHEATDEMVSRWRAQWPGVRGPYDLFPSRSPNTDYIGVEMIPLGSGLGGNPMAPGLLFTLAQHEACVALGRDCARRHEWPGDWHRTGRLVGHEDVQPINRDDAHGGWDPGYLRERPYFDFRYVRYTLDVERAP